MKVTRKFGTKDGSDELNRMLGEPKAAIRAMFVPFLIALGVVEINQFVDTYWVSGLGSDAASAVSTVVALYGLMACVGVGIGTGSTTAIAFRLGRGENEHASRLAANSLLIGAVLSVASSALLWLAFDPLISLMGAESIRDPGFEYMLPYLVLSPAIILVSVVGGMLRGEGSAKKSTYVQISSAVLNMVLDPVLIYGLGLGVMGAGLATSVSAGLATAVALHWYRSGRTVVSLRGSIGYDRDAWREILGVGGPKTGESLISNATDVIQRVFLIAAGGTSAVMFYNYAWRYIGVVNLPERAMGSAMMPVCSSALGRGDRERMWTGFTYTLRTSVAMSVVLSVLLYVFAEPLMSLMTGEASMAALLDRFVWTLRASVLLIPFSAMMNIGASMLQSMKRAKLSMYFYMAWGVVKLVLYAICAYVPMGIDPFEGIIYSMVAVHVFGGCALVLLSVREFRKIPCADRSRRPSRISRTRPWRTRRPSTIRPGACGARPRA